MELLIVGVGFGCALLSAGIVWLVVKGRCALAFERIRQERAATEAQIAERLRQRETELETLRSDGNQLSETVQTLRAELGDLRSQRAALEARAERLPELEQKLDEARRRREVDADAAAKETSDLRSHVSTLETTLAEQRKQAEEKLALLQEARQHLTEEFQNLANRIFEEKGEKFTTQNKSHLETVLNPLREQLGDFRKKIEDVYDKESKDRVSLHAQIQNLHRLNQQISEDAVNLTKALKGNNKTQGNWGEVVLESILEKSGLAKGREYVVQASLQDDDGRRRAPDVVVHLPEDRDIIIDAKVSLSAYERYAAAETDVERETAIKQHIQSVRTHIRGLSAKKYDDLVGVNTLDFVLLFVPIEPAHMLALQYDPALPSDAFEQRIMLVSPSTLLATLRTINSIWRVESQNRNAEEIASRAGDLYDKLVGFVEALEDVGSRLTQARQAYDTAHNRLVSGKGALVGRAEALRKLGAKARKQLPASVTADLDGDEVDPDLAAAEFPELG